MEGNLPRPRANHESLLAVAKESERSRRIPRF